MLYRAGARLLVGTDAPEPQVPPGYSLHHEMQLLVESGVPPAEVLRAATWNNAAVVRRQHEIGSVRAGMLADFVILDADPLADIRNTRKIFRVVKGGQVLEPSVILRSAPRE
jgi:imidazolonepropionase-like amidohydrolase